MAVCRRLVACTDVRAHPVRDALAPIRAGSFRAKSFRAPLAPESLSLCVLKEKVTKEKEHPAYALAGHRARQVRGWVTGFVDRASCPDAKLAGIPAGHPAGCSSTHPPLQRGPGKATRLLRVLFRRARATARATLRFSFSPSAGHEGPLLYLGPLCGGETGTTGRAAGVDREVDSFSPGQEPCRKARPRLTNLPGRSPASAKRGGLSLWLLSLWPHKEKVTRTPQESESSSPRTISKSAKAPRLKSPTPMQTPC